MAHSQAVGKPQSREFGLFSGRSTPEFMLNVCPENTDLNPSR
jgi:hypothetical protein